MSGWKIAIPYRSRGDDLADVAIATREIADPTERAVARTIAVNAATEGGMRSAGDLINHLAGMSQAERREVLDAAREAVGLESATDIDDAERFRMTQQMAARRSNGRDAAGEAFVGCAAEGCGAMPLGPTGMPGKVADRLWWCPEHRHLAGPSDHLPPDDVVTIGLNFQEIPAPSVQRRMEAENERHRAEQERRREERAAEAEAIRHARERYYEKYKDDPYVNPWSGPVWRAAP